MSTKTALIFGVTGQDGSYLAEYLRSLDYRVIGVARRVANRVIKVDYEIVECDVTDANSVFKLVKTLKPNEIYNLSAQSHVGISFEEPVHTFNVTTIGCLNILDAILNESPESRFFQASSSEMFGGKHCVKTNLVEGGQGEVEYEEYQDETTPFEPKSPYAIAKTAAHQLVDIYRKKKIYACSGIMFNHESERRGEKFVTRKITKYVGKLANNLEPLVSGTHQLLYWESYLNYPKLTLGDINVRRDWGYAPDFVKAMHLMLNHKWHPKDYVVCTGVTHSLKDLLEISFKAAGFHWKDFVQTDISLFRPNEISYSRGNYYEINKDLGWKPTTSFEDMIKKMVKADIEHERRQKLERPGV
jgi:GDPmannose 4,6-dehydratase